MSAHPLPILFEAVVAPSRSLSRRGLTLLTIALLMAALAMGVVFLTIGAWPVLGFTGLELILVIGLLICTGAGATGCWRCSS